MHAYKRIRIRLMHRVCVGDTYAAIQGSQSAAHTSAWLQPRCEGGRSELCGKQGKSSGPSPLLCPREDISGGDVALEPCKNLFYSV